MFDANALIGTRIPAPRQMEMALASWQSLDYFYLQPYPHHAFGSSQWPADKGPIPTALPYAQMLIAEGAEFVFRNGVPHFSVPDDQEADDFIRSVIRGNNLDEMWIPLAENNGNQGALAAKWCADLDDPTAPVRINFLDIPQECRLWIDPHNGAILMARVQYPYRDLTDGKWYYYREEWTDEWFVEYEPRFAGESEIGSPKMLVGYMSNLGDGENWHETQRTQNPFGIVPFHVIKNKAEKGNPMGVGDCWTAFRVMDRIALTLHGEDRSNQLHSEPIPVAENAEIDSEGPLVPGEPIKVTAENPNLPGHLKLLEPTGVARVHSQWDIEKWEDILYRHVGLSRIDTTNVTNKGNMTAIAFSMAFARSIATSDRKRQLWGASGMCVFFQKMIEGLRTWGGISKLGNKPKDTVVTVEWPPYFEATDEDKMVLTTRTAQQVQQGFLPYGRGAQRIAKSEKIPSTEIPKLLDELEKARAAALREARRLSATAGKNGNGEGGKDKAGTVSELANLAAATGVNNFSA